MIEGDVLRDRKLRLASYFMTGSKKREKQSIEDETENTHENVMFQFAEIISQSLLEKDVSQSESFEFYAHQLRTHLHANPDLFKARFSEGYRSLLEELERESIP